MRPLQIAAGALSPAQPALFFRWCYGRGRRWRGIGVPRVADDEPLPAALLVDGKVLADFDRSTRLGLDRVGSRFPGKVTGSAHVGLRVDAERDTGLRRFSSVLGEIRLNRGFALRSLGARREKYGLFRIEGGNCISVGCVIGFHPGLSDCVDGCV